MEFVSLVRVRSKEQTKPQPIQLYEAQYRFLAEICKGLDQGRHFFVCLKARQLGISTVMWLLDMFWLWMHPGLQGSMIFDTGENRDVAREQLTNMIESLPPGYRIPLHKHNRTGLFLKNESVLQYLAAGRRKTGSGLGRSRAFSFVHGSEAAFWGDQKGFEALVRALAQENPDRLYVFESTANGFNFFEDLCRKAKQTPSQHYFFIGWWAKELYRHKEGSAEYLHWWAKNPHLTDDERIKCAIVKEKYGHEISSEQISWYRAESFSQGSGMMAQELPWDDTEAFVATGSAFFSLKRVTEDMRMLEDAKIGFEGYAYTLGDRFTDTRISRVSRVEDAELRIWDEPRKEGRYAIGVDCAYGRSENADSSVISVWRCFSDKIVQVAEFATAKPEAQQAAWVLAHLAGCYRDCMINVDIIGPGELIMAELKHLKQQMTIGDLRDIAREMKIADALVNARWFLSHRLDSVGRGSYLYNTRTNSDEKARLFGRYRDGYNIETVIPRSMPLLGEMTTLVQNGLKIEASGRNKDDRVFAATLAIAAWTDWVRPSMMTQNRSFLREMAREKQLSASPDQQVVNHIVLNHFKREAQIRQRAQIQRLIDGI